MLPADSIQRWQIFTVHFRLVQIYCAQYANVLRWIHLLLCVCVLHIIINILMKTDLYFYDEYLYQIVMRLSYDIYLI